MNSLQNKQDNRYQIEKIGDFFTEEGFVDTIQQWLNDRHEKRYKKADHIAALVSESSPENIIQNMRDAVEQYRGNNESSITPTVTVHEIRYIIKKVFTRDEVIQLIDAHYNIDFMDDETLLKGVGMSLLKAGIPASVVLEAIIYALSPDLQGSGALTGWLASVPHNLLLQRPKDAFKIVLKNIEKKLKENHRESLQKSLR